MSKLITPADTEYEDVHRAWVTHGRPSQFDRQGSFGGAVYRCYNTDEEEPDFYEAFSMGPTVVDERGKVVQEGWHLINRKYLYMRAGVDRHGRPWVKRPEFPT